MGEDQPGSKFGEKLILVSSFFLSFFLFFRILLSGNLGATSSPPSSLTTLLLHKHNEVFSCDRACSIDFKLCFCALTATLCPLSLTVFQSSGHSSRNQKLPVWPPATPCYRLMKFSASLKGLCGAENVINKGESAGAGFKGCCRLKKCGREEAKRGHDPFIERVCKGWVASSVGCQFWYHVELSESGNQEGLLGSLLLIGNVWACLSVCFFFMLCKWKGSFPDQPCQ